LPVRVVFVLHFSRGVSLHRRQAISKWVRQQQK
jgi:hypothetical protein